MEQADAEVEACAEVQAVRGGEVCMGPSAVRISGATFIERECIILLNQVAECAHQLTVEMSRQH